MKRKVTSQLPINLLLFSYFELIQWEIIFKSQNFKELYCEIHLRQKEYWQQMIHCIFLGNISKLKLLSFFDQNYVPVIKAHSSQMYSLLLKYYSKGLHSCLESHINFKISIKVSSHLWLTPQNLAYWDSFHHIFWMP